MPFARALGRKGSDALRWRGAGPEKEGPYGPYRQSERTAIYKQYVDQLVEKGLAYPCFCSDEEITAMKEEAERKGIPPIYRFPSP